MAVRTIDDTTNVAHAFRYARSRPWIGPRQAKTLSRRTWMKGAVRMPGGDGAGPRGTGPMSGRNMGICILASNSWKRGNITGVFGIDGKPVEFTNSEASTFALQAAVD